MSSYTGGDDRVAAEAAHRHIRHLLRPETVHLLRVGDIAEAVAVAGDILAPAERRAAAQAADLQQQLWHAEARAAKLRGERDEARWFADSLTEILGELAGADLRRRAAPGRWEEALQVAADVAAACRSQRPEPRW